MTQRLNANTGVGLWLKWTLLVWMNAIVGLVVTWDNMRQDGVPYWLGVGLGVCVFIPLYALVERSLRRRGVRGIGKALTIGAIIRALLQIAVVVDVLAGMVGISVAENVVGAALGALGEGDAGQKFGIYFVTTVVTGALLSVVAWVLTALVLLGMRLVARRRQPPLVTDTTDPTQTTVE